MFFFKRMRACETCGVAYEPPTSGMAADWAHLCPTHREPAMDEAYRKRRVADWAQLHWVRLEKQMKEELAAMPRAANNTHLADLFKAQQAAMQNSALANIGAAAVNLFNGY